MLSLAVVMRNIWLPFVQFLDTIMKKMITLDVQQVLPKMCVVYRNGTIKMAHVACCSFHKEKMF